MSGQHKTLEAMQGSLVSDQTSSVLNNPERGPLGSSIPDDKKDDVASLAFDVLRAAPDASPIWRKLPRVKPNTKIGQQVVVVSGRSFPLEQLRIGEMADGDKKIDVAQIRSTLNQPAPPGYYRPLADLYAEAVENGKSIFSSDHPRLVAEYKEKGLRFTTWNIYNLEASSATDGRSIFKDNPGVLTDTAVEESRKELIINQITDAQSNPKQRSDVIALQEYCLNPEQESDLLKKLGPSWRIVKHSKGNVATLYDSNVFEYSGTPQHDDPSDMSWQRLSLVFKLKKDNSLLTVHNAWVRYDLTTDQVREGIELIHKEKPKATTGSTSHAHIFLMDVNKDVPRPTQGGPAQLVPLKFRFGTVGSADTDVALVADDKSVRILSSQTYSPVEGAEKLETKESNAEIDLSSYSLKDREEFTRMRAYAPLTTEARAIKPDDKTDLISYQKQLREIIGTDLVEIGPAGNMLGETCFLQAKLAVSAESDNAARESFQNFHAYIKVVSKIIPSSPAAQGIDCAEYSTGLESQHVINAKNPQALQAIALCLEDFRGLITQLIVLNKEFPDIKATLGCTEGGQLRIQFSVEETGNKGKFAGSVANYLDIHSWPPFTFNGNRLDQSSAYAYVAAVKKTLQNFTVKTAEAKNIADLQNLLKDKTGDQNLQLALICKNDESKSDSPNRCVKLVSSCQAGYLQYLAQNQERLGIVVYSTGIVHVPIEKMDGVVAAIEKQKSEKIAEEKSSKKLAEILNQSLRMVDDNVANSISTDESGENGYIDEEGAWLRCSSNAHSYFLNVIESILGKKPETRPSSTDGSIYICIPNEQLDHFIKQLPAYYRPPSDKSMFDMERGLQEIVGDGALSLTRKLEGKDCRFHLRSSSPYLAKFSTNLGESTIVVDGTALPGIYSELEKQAASILLESKEQVSSPASTITTAWLKKSVSNVCSVSYSLADEGRVILRLPLNVAYFLAKNIIVEPEGIILQSLIMQGQQCVKMSIPRSKAANFMRFLQSTFGEKSTVPLDGTPSLEAYATQLNHLTKGDGNINIISSVNKIGDNIDYRITLPNQGIPAWIAKKIQIETAGGDNFIVCPATKLKEFDTAIKQYYAVKVLSTVSEDKGRDLNIGEYSQRLMNIGFTRTSINLAHSDEDPGVSDQKSTVSAVRASGGEDQITIFFSFSEFNDGFKTELEKKGHPYRVNGRTVTFPISVMSAFDNLALQYVVSQKCKKVKTDALVSTLLSGLTANGKTADTGNPKEKRASTNSANSTSVPATDKADSKLSSPIFEDVLLYLLQPDCALNLDEFWTAVKPNKIKKEAMRSMINDSIIQLLRDKPEAEQLEIVNIICQSSSFINRLLTPKNPKPLFGKKKIDYIDQWRKKQIVLAKEPLSNTKLSGLLSEAAELENVDKVQLDEASIDKYKELLNSDASHLVTLRKKYLLLSKSCSEEDYLFTQNERGSLQRGQVSLTSKDLRDLVQAMNAANAAFQEALAAYRKARQALTPAPAEKKGAVPRSDNEQTDQAWQSQGEAERESSTASIVADDKQNVASKVEDSKATMPAIPNKQPPPLPATPPRVGGRPSGGALTGSHTLAGSMQKAGSHMSQSQNSASVSGEPPKKKDGPDDSGPKSDNGDSGLDLTMLS